MDALIITNLTIATQIGVYAWEQRIKQNVLIDIHIPSDFRHCEDDLKKTIDYALLCQTITQWVESRSFLLIETLANEIAKLIQETFKVEKLTVAVSKPHAVKNAAPIKVIVER
ncbi:MAG: dihydroneopterin aldolase [Legionella sp.]|nr:dihydroneopterin aldolase [Legionella sp.]